MTEEQKQPLDEFERLMDDADATYDRAEAEALLATLPEIPADAENIAVSIQHPH
jgi:hypothetical protein